MKNHKSLLVTFSKTQKYFYKAKWNILRVKKEDDFFSIVK